MELIQHAFFLDFINDRPIEVILASLTNCVQNNVNVPEVNTNVTETVVGETGVGGANSTNIQNINILFPSVCFPTVRMTLVLTNYPLSYLHMRTLVYSPREKLAEFVHFMDGQLADEMPQMLVHGFIGTGKSYMLAAYVLYMQCARILGSSSHRVVYLSNCSLVNNDLLTSVQMALHLAFPEDMINIDDLKSMENVIAYAERKATDGVRLLFVVDDWNFYQDATTASVVQNKELLLILFSLGQTVYGVSANNDVFYSNIAVQDSFYMRGLTTNEWLNCWKPKHILFQALNGDAETLFRHMTGDFPLILNKLLNKYEDENTLEGKLERFMNDPEVFCGGWMLLKLYLFFLNLPSNVGNPLVLQLSTDNYITTMTNAIGGISMNTTALSIYSHRFFYFESGKVIPSCGIVTRIVTQLLVLYKNTVLTNTLNASWIKFAWESSNPSVKGFSFETYCLLNAISAFKSFVLDPLKIQSDSIPTVDVNHYHGNYPAPSYLNQSINSLTFYWPDRWNKRYENGTFRWVSISDNIDHLRTVTKEEYDQLSIEYKGKKVRESINVDVPTANSKKLKKSKRGTAAATVPKSVTIYKSKVKLTRNITVRVTMQPPTDQAGTLDFYRVPHDSILDCARYTIADDTADGGIVENYLLWIVPRTLTVEQRVTPVMPDGPIGRPNVQQFVHPVTVAV